MSDNPPWEFHPGSSRAVCGYLYAVGTMYAMIQWYVRSKMERTCSDQISKLNSTPVTASLLTFVRVISVSLLLRTVWLFVAAAAPLEYLCTGSTGQAEYCDTVYVVPVARLSQFLFYVAFTIIGTFVGTPAACACDAASLCHGVTTVSFWTQWSAGPHPDPLPSYVSKCATFFVVANVWMFMLQAVATALLMYVAQVDVMEKQAPSLMVRKLLVAYEGVQAGTFLGLAVALFVSGYWLRKYLISLVKEYEERSLRLGMQHRLAIGAVRIPNPLSATVNHVTQAYEADLERTGADSRATGSTHVLQSSAVKLTASALVVVALFVLRAALLAIMAADAMNMGTNTSNFVSKCTHHSCAAQPSLILLVAQLRPN